MNDEKDIFRALVGEVRPVRHDRVKRDRPKPKPDARFRKKDEASALEESLHSAPDLETGAELVYLQSGYQKRWLRRLRRGQYAIQGSLDLHHMNAQAAREAITDFLADARYRGAACVKIIHGKGLRSQQAPVLKGLTEQLLRRRKDVIAFVSAPPRDGGTGAVYVLLKI